MIQDFGHFTAYGNEQVELAIRQQIFRISEALRAELMGLRCSAILLLGGYGKGEGGVVTVDGEQRPHNNLDFLVILEHARRGQKRQYIRRAHERLRQIKTDADLGVDLTAMTESEFKQLETRLIWHDMVEGHKVIWGRRRIATALRCHTLDKVPAWDFRNLLVNRGSLLMINRVLLQQKPHDPEVRRAVIKHICKAIIGYGDAYLYFNGRYHWSYLEKRTRMQALDQAPAELKHLYDEAARFRLQPDYEPYLQRDLMAWNEEVIRKMQPVHLFCERTRLNSPDLEWDAYAERAVQADLVAVRSWQQILLRIKNLLLGESVLPVASPWLRLLGRALGLQGGVPIAFPLVAYTAKSSQGLRDQATRRYVRNWAEANDPNFVFVQQKYGFSL